MYISIYVKYLLFLSYFNESWISSTDFREMLKYQISWKSVQWEPSCSIRKDGKSDRHARGSLQSLFPVSRTSLKMYFFFHCHLCKSQFANFSSLCRHSRGEFLNKVTNNWQPISSLGKILRSVSFNLGNGTKSVFLLWDGQPHRYAWLITPRHQNGEQ